MPRTDPQHELNAWARARLLQQTPFLLRFVPILLVLWLTPLSWALVLALSAGSSAARTADSPMVEAGLFLGYAASSLLTKWAFPFRRTRWQLAAFCTLALLFALFCAAGGDVQLALVRGGASASGALAGIVAGRLLWKGWLRRSLR